MSTINRPAAADWIQSGPQVAGVAERTSTLEKVYLSDAGPKVSPAIYGFYRWMTESATTPEAMEKTVNLCLEAGINKFDHANIYGLYQCGELFGKALQRRSFCREDVCDPVYQMRLPGTGPGRPGSEVSPLRYVGSSYCEKRRQFPQEAADGLPRHFPAEPL